MSKKKQHINQQDHPFSVIALSLSLSIRQKINDRTNSKDGCNYRPARPMIIATFSIFSVRKLGRYMRINKIFSITELKRKEKEEEKNFFCFVSSFCKSEQNNSYCYVKYDYGIQYTISN